MTATSCRQCLYGATSTMASRINDLMDLSGLGTGVLTHDTGVGNCRLPISEGSNILKEILPREPANNISLFVSVLVQEGKMRNPFHSKLVELLFPLCVIDVQHNKIDTIPAMEDALYFIEK